MMGKAIGLGLQLDPAITAKYLDASGPVPVTTLGGLYAMDHINNSKTGLYSLEQPVHRPVAAGSTVSNSVAVRIMHDTSYSPIKLTLSGRNLDPSYPTVPTVLTAQPLAWS